jgi:hypothetical protein
LLTGVVHDVWASVEGELRVDSVVVGGGLAGWDIHHWQGIARSFGIGYLFVIPSLFG